MDRVITDKSFRDLEQVVKQLDNVLSSSSKDIKLITEHVLKERREKILSWVSTVKHDNAHYSDKRMAMAGTGLWLLETAEHDQWRKSSSPRTLWLHGFMGSGKSCLSHVVVEDFKAKTQDNVRQQLAFFYCDGTDKQTASEITDATIILRSLVKQLSSTSRTEELKTSIVRMYDELQGRADLNQNQSVQLLLDLIKDSTDTTFVIDGLDECPLPVQRNLMKSLKEILQRAVQTVWIFVASRRMANIRNLLEDVDPFEINVAEHNTADINNLITTRVNNDLEDPVQRDLYENQRLNQAKATIQVLQEYAQGMFRWVQMAFDYLHGSQNAAIMVRRLDTLPLLQDLFDLYDRIYETMMDDLDTEDQEGVRTLFTMMLYQQNESKLHYDEGHEFIMEASSFAAGYPFEKGYSNVSGVARMCPSFVEYHDLETDDEEVRQRFRFPNFSVPEYLRTSRADDYSMANGHASLATLSIRPFTGDQALSPLDGGGSSTSRAYFYDLMYGLYSGMLFVNYAADCWMKHLLHLHNLHRRSWQFLENYERLQIEIQAFLLQSPVTSTFLRWHQYWAKACPTADYRDFRARDVGSIAKEGWREPAAVCHTPTPSSILARMLLDLK